MSTTFATSRPTSVLPGETLQAELCHQKAINQPKRTCRLVNWASGAFCTAPKPMQSTPTPKFSGMMLKAARRDYDGPVGLQLSLALMSVPSSLLIPAVLGNVKNASTEEKHSEVRPDSRSSFHIHNLPTSSHEHLSDKKRDMEESMRRGRINAPWRRRQLVDSLRNHHDRDVHYWNT